MLTLLLTRHGHTDRSEPEQYLGQHINAELSARGRADARKLARRLAAVEMQRVVSSPLKRARETADILARSHNITVEPEPRLLELDYGDWEGHTLEDINTLFPGEYEKYDRDPAHHEVGGGESGTEVAARLWPFIDGLLDWAETRGGEAKAESTALLVGHSSTNRIMLAMLLGVELNDYRRRFDQDWTNLTVLRWPTRADGPRLLLSNDQSHTRGMRGVTWG
ncbi:MAG TPA: histidine phosphatase family protein [Candidatus Limnocylindria bacterium]|nr:histidine phosphatase family protein [Candidatus Limnocylindria bacterium]